MKNVHFLFEQFSQKSCKPEEVQRGERAAAYLLLILAVLLRIVYIFRYRFDSDEPQHLHVVWGWAHGLLQYRDVVDNHAPLFHLLCVPLYKIFGDNLNVLFAMRLAMLPLFIMVLWCTYLIGREIFSHRVGLWAAVFTGLFPLFFLCSVEFRTDNLWTALWLLAVTILIGGNLKVKKCFWVGFLLGAAMGVSMKTTLLLTSLAAGALATILFSPDRYLSRYALRRLLTYAFSMLAGFSVVPLILLLFFYYIKDIGPFFYGTIEHNVFPGLGLWHRFYVRALIFPVSLAILYWFARIIGKNTAHEGQRSKRVFICFIGGIYFSALKAFWPVLEWQHYLPFYPLFVIILTPVVLRLLPLWILKPQSNEQLNHRFLGWSVPALIIFLEIVSILCCGEGAPWHNRTSRQMQLLSDVLQLTGPGDFVADLKGEMIFRQRSTYYILEIITRERIKRGLLVDDIPERLIATRTCVASRDSKKFPVRTRAFLRDNYLPVGSLRVAGKFLPPASEKNNSISFDIQIPAQYVIISKNGPAAGTLDGTPYTGACFLKGGHHEFRVSLTNDRFALIWAKAQESGFSPFS